MSDEPVLSVSALTEQLKGLLEKTFPYVSVRGEVTNLARPSSGHIYFSMRDGRSLLNCVWFRNARIRAERFDPLTGEVFTEDHGCSIADSMRDGDAVVCSGTVTAYPDRGQYQLRVESVRSEGEGDLLQQFEALKRKLDAKGMFSMEHKRPLPTQPTDVIVITAPTGAAVRDFLRIVGQNAIGARIRILPVPVQGTEAAPAIIDALGQANADGTAQLAVIIRGGGSLEDLWAFNDETLAEAVFSSRLPVLTGIGHEVDTSLCDLVADMRAATPTHAAQMLWQGKGISAQRVDALDLLLHQNAERRLSTIGQCLSNLERVLAARAPMERLAHADESLKGMLRRLTDAAKDADTRRILSLRFLRARLDALDPDAPLRRGYAMVHTSEGTLVRSALQCTSGDPITVSLTDGILSASVIGAVIR